MTLRRRMIENPAGRVETKLEHITGDRLAMALSHSVGGFTEWVVHDAVARPVVTRTDITRASTHVNLRTTTLPRRQLKRSELVRGCQVARVNEQMFDMSRTATQRMLHMRSRRSVVILAVERPVWARLRALRGRVRSAVSYSSSDDDSFQ